MNIIFLTLYIMLWTLGICASYAFVMTAVKKDASLPFLRRASLLAFLSYGASWFFGVLYYIHPDTVARFAKLAPPSANIRLQTFFTQQGESIFLSFVFVSVFAAWLSVSVFSVKGAEAADAWAKRKNDMVFLSTILTFLGVLAILFAIMIA